MDKLSTISAIVAFILAAIVAFIVWSIMLDVVALLQSL